MSAVPELIWLGPHDHELGWLMERFQQTTTVHLRTSLATLEEIGDLDVGNACRIVIACRTRLEYRPKLTAELVATWPEIPVSVALSNWWSGAGRTGFHQRDQRMIPWYRWWDYWYPWLHGDTPELLTPAPSMHDYVRIRTKRTRRRWRGLIVSRDRQLSDAWVAWAEHNGDTAACIAADAWLESYASQTPPDWLLWDDSCLKSTPGQDEVQGTVEFFQEARGRFPDSLLCGAVSLPHWSRWKSAQRAGADEMLVKPGTGHDFRRLLAFHAQQRCI